MTENSNEKQNAVILSCSNGVDFYLQTHVAKHCQTLAVFFDSDFPLHTDDNSAASDSTGPQQMLVPVPFRSPIVATIFELWQECQVVKQVPAEHTIKTLFTHDSKIESRLAASVEAIVTQSNCDCQLASAEHTEWSTLCELTSAAEYFGFDALVQGALSRLLARILHLNIHQLSSTRDAVSLTDARLFADAAQLAQRPVAK